MESWSLVGSFTEPPKASFRPQTSLRQPPLATCKVDPCTWDFANCNATWNLFNLVTATLSTNFSPYLCLLLPIPSQNHLLLLDRQPRPEMHCCSWTKPIRKIFLWNSLIRKHLGIGFGFQSGVLCEAWMALRSLEKFIYVQFASTQHTYQFRCTRMIRADYVKSEADT